MDGTRVSLGWGSKPNMIICQGCNFLGNQCTAKPNLICYRLRGYPVGMCWWMLFPFSCVENHPCDEWTDKGSGHIDVGQGA